MIDATSSITPAAISSGLTGIQRGLERIDQASANIARVAVSKNNQDTQDIARSLVDIKVAEHQIEASAKTLKANHQTLGYLLDVLS